MSGDQPASGESSPTISRPLARRLLVITSVVFAIWIAGLLGMYFTTVYPQTHATPATAR